MSTISHAKDTIYKCSKIGRDVRKDLYDENLLLNMPYVLNRCTDLQFLYNVRYPNTSNEAGVAYLFGTGLPKREHFTTNDNNYNRIFFITIIILLIIIFIIRRGIFCGK